MDVEVRSFDKVIPEPSGTTRQVKKRSYTTRYALRMSPQQKDYYLCIPAAYPWTTSPLNREHAKMEWRNRFKCLTIGVLGVVEEELALASVSIVQATTPIPFGEAMTILLVQETRWQGSKTGRDRRVEASTVGEGMMQDATQIYVSFKVIVGRGQVTERGETCLAPISFISQPRLFHSYTHHRPYTAVATMQSPSQPLTQFPSTATPDRSAILAPPNLAPDDTDWISNASRIFKVVVGAGELDPSNIAKAIANIALPILELAQDHKKAHDELKDTVKYLDEMLSYVSEEINLLQEGQSSVSVMNASTHRLARLQQMGDEFVNHLKDLKDDLNKIYGKTGFRAKMKRPFQGKAILDRINQHKVYVKDARDKLIMTAVLSGNRQVEEVAAKVTVIHDHLMSPSRTQPVNPLFSSIMLSSIPPPAPSVFLGRDDLVQEGIANLLADSPHSIVIMGFGGMGKTSLALKILNDEAVQAKYGAHRYFIPCDIVCSVDSTVEILLQTVMTLMNLGLTSDAVKQLHTIFFTAFIKAKYIEAVECNVSFA
ncbi:hypothetical protein EDD18DRAFT_1375403 [Armillaria luteobubalina]|uniref:NB-ARC domain-containing protein n=1 Tax=Armillaria luteobubalina TaxID=153913 RepID=A0AA39QS72_9AGAR|nr:hypothetical protein EDD18DRAFT_1375403 [Armillaria luteobubalina]